MAGRDTRARYEGVYARHASGCAKTASKSAACDCRPSYYGVVYDRKTGKTRKTKHFPTVSAARNARGDLATALREGRPVGSSGMRLDTAAEKFVAAAAEGIALTKHGRRYKPNAVIDLRSSLKILSGASSGIRLYRWVSALASRPRLFLPPDGERVRTGQGEPQKARICERSFPCLSPRGGTWPG